MRLSVRWSDRLITTVLVVLIAGSTLAFGGVHRAAFTIIETTCFLLPLGWLIKVWQEAPARPRLAIATKPLLRFALPLAAISGLIVAQLIPMPPRGLRIVAPKSFQLYQKSLPGWPWFAPYQSLAPMTASQNATSGSSIQSRPAATQANRGALPSGWSKLYWRTLSIAPTVTASSLIEWLALATVFLVVLSYPVGLIGERDAEGRFQRNLILAAMVVGTVIAVVGLFERAWWNGKLLWFYIPRDWGGPLFPNPPRASGPFVDPDHFANYLAMVLPLAVVATLFPLDFVPREWRDNVRLAAGLGCTIIAPAILLSLSRAGWIAAIAGVGTVLFLSIRWSPSLAPKIAESLGKRWIYYATAALLFLVVGLFFFAGPIGEGEIANRVMSTFGGFSSGIYRPLVWRDTLRMIADFPFFGVGLGCWPEHFPHYQRPPWIPFFFREAENDYIQFIAETGLVGGILLGWLGVAAFRSLYQNITVLSERQRTLFAGLIGSITAFLIHEISDFSFRTPANALLFVILGALALRIALTAESRRPTEPKLVTRKASHLVAQMTLCGAICTGLIILVWLQDGEAYPYGVINAPDATSAVRTLARHPAMGSAHLALVGKANPDTPAALRSLLIRSAVWLDPNNPIARDLYMQDLLRGGDKAGGLEQITLSTFHAPRLEAHYYLGAQSIPWLLPEEQAAVVAGFERAIQNDFDGSVDALAGFYRNLGRYKDIAELNVRMAKEQADPMQQIDYLVEAGRNYAMAGDDRSAEEILNSASRIDPADAHPYAELIRSVYGPSHRLDQARETVKTAISNGADPFELSLGLADGAAAAGDRDAVVGALEDALRYRSSFETAMRLGTAYLEDKRFGRAATAFSRATELRPFSAEAWFDLGQSYERDYDYAAAGKAYHRAQTLAPENQYYARIYSTFEERTAASPQQAGADPKAATR
ncbi:MAG TPA: O-antigen ligase family protein [Candidatus Binataceae bacterium]|nr:O-antigen ligase family protein [Candidatus Binataceae bacterium]